jgi:hypothetical protein
MQSLLYLIIKNKHCLVKPLLFGFAVNPLGQDGTIN